MASGQQVNDWKTVTDWKDVSAPEQPKQPEQRGFMGSLYDATIGGLINGVKDYVTNGSPSAQGLRTAARGLELYQKQDKGPLTADEQKELDGLELPTPSGYETPLSQHPVTGNAVRATQQAASGNYAGAAGTMASYPVMAAAGAIVPRIPGAAKAAYRATADLMSKPGTMQMATGGAQLAGGGGALLAGHPIVAGAAALRGVENIQKGYAARVEAANAPPPIYDDIAQGMGGSDFKSLDIHRQGIVKSIAEQLQAKDAAGASAQPAAQPLPTAKNYPVGPPLSLNDLMDQELAANRAGGSQGRPVVTPEAPASASLRAPLRAPVAQPGRFDPNSTWQERLAQLGVKEQAQPMPAPMEATPAPAAPPPAPEPAPAIPPKAATQAPDFSSLREMSVPTPKVVTGAQFETAARYAKAQALAKFLYQDGEGVPHDYALKMDPKQWAMAQKGAGVAGPPSPKTIAIALDELKKLEVSQPIARQMAAEVNAPEVPVEATAPVIPPKSATKPRRSGALTR